MSPGDLVPLELRDDGVPGDALLLGAGHVLERVALHRHHRPHVSLVRRYLTQEYNIETNHLSLNRMF